MSDAATSPKLRQRNVISKEAVEATTDQPIADDVNTPPLQNGARKRQVSKNEFRQRTSTLDSLGEKRSQSEFRGFFNLVTMGLVFFFVTQQTKSIISYGTLIGLGSVWNHFNRYDLLPGWLFMCAFSFSAVILQKIILLQVLPRVVVSTLRVVLQCLFFGVSLFVGLNRNFPVVQSCFYLTELLILTMKMHSYIMTNREYDKEYRVQQKLNKEGKAGKEEAPEDGTRRTASVSYPNNVTFANYLGFLLVPTCVYELEYPRTEKVRLPYLAEKFFSFVGLWAVLHVIVDSMIMPVLVNSPNMSGIEAVCHMIIPATGVYLILFYLVFDVGCNGFAELTRFADREFYSDWWNSVTFDEFARKWNKPVHEFLLRHVYLETINSYKISKNNATVITFLFSSIVHEFFMAFTLQMFRPWLFFFQMTQLPLIYISRIPFFRKHHNVFGNFFFWFGMILGPPMISLLYAREFFLLYQ